MKNGDPFDTAASQYDREFTGTAVGRLQRQVVHRYLKRHVKSGMKVLEINCGTGDDAFFLAGLGCEVTATDASEGMIREALRKQENHPAGKNITFRKLSFTELDELQEQPKSDLVFSDFSGLNCIDPVSIQHLSDLLQGLLKPTGNMIFVLFGKRCIWERIFFLLKRKPDERDRRKSDGPVGVGIPGNVISVWYYSVKEITLILDQGFRRISVKPVGLFIPPSWLDPYFRNKKWILKILSIKESLFGRFAFLSDYGDHFLIHLQKK